MEINNFETGSMSLVIYDISDNRKRTKFAKFISGYGTRVQKSAFEIDTKRGRIEELIDKFPQFISNGDSIRLYPGSSSVKSWGKSNEIIGMDSFVIV